MKLLKIILPCLVILTLAGCQRKATCSCKGDTTSQTFQLHYDEDLPDPIDQCNDIEANSTDNFVCLYRG